MNPFSEMMRKIQSTVHYCRMVRFARPLYDHFGVNHFWYYRITRSGAYSYVGTHAAWNEYCFDRSLLAHFPCLRHPSILRRGINLMKADDNEQYKEVQKQAWDKFNINFNFNIFDNCSEGIEAFGFGTRFQEHEVKERLINELPLLRHFIKEVRQKHETLFHLLEENTVDLPVNMGAIFYERPKKIVLPFERSLFLRQIGLGSIELTPREKDIARFLASGFPASYIKDKLHLGLRTVENYIATLKGKLFCRSKVELIKKTQELASIGFLDE
jgi:DNA-binding CsgD family transcriptional regulator